MNKTQIEWVKNPDGTQGYTWNPITGCLNHVEGMCKGGNFPCYAYGLANGRLKSRYLANDNIAPFEMTNYRSQIERKNNPFYPRFWPERLQELNQGYKRNKGIFVCDMSDLFGIGVPEEWTRQVLDAMKRTWMNPYCRFYLLTKQPQNLIKWSPFPDNCWVGQTVTGWKSYSDFLFYSQRYEAKVKYISIEPLLQPLHFSHLDLSTKANGKPDLDWVIIGSQTKPYKPPKIEWVKEIVEACDKADVKVFLKDNLLKLVNYQSRETAFAFNKEGYYRQEMPR